MWWLLGRGTDRNLGAAQPLLERLDLALGRVEPGPEFPNERVEVADQTILERELDLEVDELVGKLRWIGHGDLLSRGMRAACLVGLVVIASCEVPTRDAPSPESSSPSNPAPRSQAPGVDCRLIAQTLTSLEMGNYAPPEEREPRERVIEDLCTRARLTKQDADCLLASPTVADLAFCAKPLVMKPAVQPPLAPGDVCEKYVRVLERIARCAKMPADSASALRQQLPQLRKMYAEFGHQQQVKDNCQMAIDATERAYQPLGC